MSGARQIVLASRNPHKLAELGELLIPLELVPLPAEVELPPEDGTSFADNALIKARAAARASGRPALADDSGIVVHVLGGAPGIHSARYAGESASDEQNLDKLLAGLAGEADRRAAYVCVLALVEADRDGVLRETLAEARCEGRILDGKRGVGGFGYDPSFMPDEYADRDLTMAEITQTEKHAISHRGRAARKLLALLAERG